MSTYSQRTIRALDRVDEALAALDAAVAAMPAEDGLPAGVRTRLDETLDRLGRASAALRTSFGHLEHTALDVVDLQVRLEGQNAALAAALRSLGETVEDSEALRARLLDHCAALEEAASSLATATFPSAVEGLAAVNRALWDFRGLVWTAYERKLAEVVARRSLNSAQVAAIEETARHVRSRFDAVNDLINHLAESGFHDRTEVAGTVADARQQLTEALAHARSRAGDDAYKPFHRVLGQAEKVAEQVSKHLGRCRIPVFPRAEGLEDAAACVAGDFYGSLSGVCRFALLNILAGLRAIKVPGGDGHLLTPRFVRQVFAVFPDRIYLEATPDLLGAIDALQRAGAFASAPAALHRFRDGSVKQRQHRKGNLQLSYERGDDVVRVDADIDLYRGPISHLFGEVLINHLTGSTTDQFTVRKTLDARGVTPIGDFQVWSPPD